MYYQIGSTSSTVWLLNIKDRALYVATMLFVTDIMPHLRPEMFTKDCAINEARHRIDPLLVPDFNIHINLIFSLCQKYGAIIKC